MIVFASVSRSYALEFKERSSACEIQTSTVWKLMYLYFLTVPFRELDYFVESYTFLFLFETLVCKGYALNPYDFLYASLYPLNIPVSSVCLCRGSIISPEKNSLKKKKQKKQ